MKWVVSLTAVAFIGSHGIALAQTAAEREACEADFQQFCSGVAPGGGRIIACLREHVYKLTPQCKTVVEAHLTK